MSQPGLFEVGPLEKFGLLGLVLGLFIHFFQTHKLLSHLKVLDQTMLI